MAKLRYKDILNMGKEERDKKIKELKIELVKSKLGNKKSSISSKEIRRAIARLLTSISLDKKKDDIKKSKKVNKGDKK